jgi:hypothetical protein
MDFSGFDFDAPIPTYGYTLNSGSVDLGALGVGTHNNYGMPPLPGGLMEELMGVGLPAMPLLHYLGPLNAYGMSSMSQLMSNGSQMIQGVQGGGTGDELATAVGATFGNVLSGVVGSAAGPLAENTNNALQTKTKKRKRVEKDGAGENTPPAKKKKDGRKKATAAGDAGEGEGGSKKVRKPRKDAGTKRGPNKRTAGATGA